jgi:hypothetical protein
MPFSSAVLPAGNILVCDGSHKGWKKPELSTDFWQGSNRPKLDCPPLVMHAVPARSGSTHSSRPHCDRNLDSCGGSLNQPFVVAIRNNDEAIGRRMLPTRAKTLRIKLPNACVCLCRLRQRLSRHLTVRCESHREFCAAKRGSVKRLSVKKSSLDTGWGHRFCSIGNARLEKRCCN